MAAQGLMKVEEAIHSRRSIRKYTDESLTDEQIKELVELAGLAPSSMNVQPWRVIAVRDAEMKQKLQAVCLNQPQVGASAVTFVIATDMKDVLENAEETVHPGMADQLEKRAAQVRNAFGNWPEERQRFFGNGQGNIFLGFFLLAAQSKGYATSAMLGFDADGVKKLLEIPDHADIPAVVALGRPAEEGFSHHRHPVDRILRII